MRGTEDFAAIGLLCVLAAGAANAIYADDIASDTVEAFGGAAQIVRRAADALGGQEQLRKLDSISFAYGGRISARGQGTTIDEPQPFDYRQEVQVTFSPLKLRRATAFSGISEIPFENVNYLDGETSSALRDAAGILRASPHALVKHLLENPRSATLVGEDASEHWLAAGFHGDLITLHVSRSDGLIRKVVRVFDDVRHGDSLAVFEFLAYESRDKWIVPTALRVTEAGHVVIDVPFSDYGLANVELSQVTPPALREASQNLTESPADAGADDSPAPAMTPPQGDVVLGDGVTLLRNTGGFDYHSLLVETAGGAILIEAPGAVDDGKATRERAQIAAKSPLRYIASTHHHGDHSGGVAGAVFEGARLVVAEAEVPFFRDMVRARRSFARVQHQPVEDLTIESVPVRGRQEILNRVLAIDAGPSGHSESHIVYYIADAGVLFQSDMAVFRWDGSVEPARAQTCHLREVIREQGLIVQTLAGGHGRPGTLEDLDLAIELRDEGCEVGLSRSSGGGF